MRFQVTPKAGFIPAVTHASSFQAPPNVAEEQVGVPGGRTLSVLPRAFLMRRSQSGQAIVLIAVMLGVLVGMAALAIDGSRAYTLRRDLQNAVDGAALAAADNYQRTSSYSSAESAATSSFGVSLRLYSAPSCTPYGSPGPGSFTVTCTYSDGTVLTDVVPIRGAQGAMFQLTASQTLSLQFARILTNGTSPMISTTSASRVNNLLYSPTVAALAQAGCGGASGTAITVNGTGSLTLGGDLVSSGTISVSAGLVQVAGDIYARCQATVPGASTACYPSGANPACTYPDVVGVVRSGYHFTDPNYPVPGPIGGSQPAPGSSVVLSPGVYASPISVGGGRCFFLSGGVYDWQAGFTNLSDVVSNELKPPDEPNYADNTRLAAIQFWDSAGIGCSGSTQITTTSEGNGNGNCNGHGNNCNTQGGVPPGRWSFVLTSTRTDTYNGVAYQRESAPSMCYQVTVDPDEDVKVLVSNVPGATAYNIYAATNGCAGTFGLVESLPVSGPVLNSNLNPCPAFSGNGCSLGRESVTLDTTDLGPPWTPNGSAAPGVIGSFPPNSETAPLAAGLPNQNPARGPGSAGDRANENNCDSLAGAYITCPGVITPGAVAFYIPSSGCLTTASPSDTFIFSGYQYNWISIYEPGLGSPPANSCSNVLGANQNSAYVGLIYVPASSLSITASAVFQSTGTGGLIANTVSFSGNLPTIRFNVAYAPVPFAARLVS